MNIMLGPSPSAPAKSDIRKAVGARKSDIVVQFLTEAVVLNWLRRLSGHDARLADLAGIPPGPFPSLADLGAAMVGRSRRPASASVSALFFGTWPGNESRAARSRGGAAV